MREAARYSPAPVRRTLQPSCSPYISYACGASLAPCAVNIHYWQAAARSGYDYGVVHIKYVVTWTANQNGLVTLTFDLLILKVVYESRVSWATYVPILVFLSLSVLELGPMYATEVRQTDVRQNHRLMPPPIRGGA